jgi:WD40 repeat protein
VELTQALRWRYHRGVQDFDVSADPSPQRMRFSAFISYRHAPADSQWAEWLQRALTRYRLPRRFAAARKLPRRLQPVFRDYEELPAGPHLPEKIRAALDASDALVVISSPRTRESEWVQKELEYFAGLGRQHRLFALVIEGEPAATMPPALVTADSIAADVRPRPPTSMRHVRRVAVTRLVAGLLGCEFSDLLSSEGRARRRRTIALTALTCAVAATIAGLGQSALSSARATALGRMQLRAEEALREIAAGDAVRGLQLALAGVDESPPWLAMPVASELERAVLAGVREHRAVLSVRVPGARDVSLSTDNTRLVVLAESTATVLRLDDEASPVTISDAVLATASHIGFSDDGRLVRAELADGGLVHWNSHDGAATNTPAPPGTTRVGPHAAVNVGREPDVTTWMAPDGRRLASRDTETITVVDAASQVAQGTLNDVADAYVAWAPTSDRLAAYWPHTRLAGDPRTLVLWNARGRSLGRRVTAASAITALAWSPDGSLVAIGLDNGHVALVDGRFGTLVGTFVAHRNALWGLQFSDEGQRVATWAGDQFVRIWDSRSGGQLGAIRAPSTEVVRFSPDGSLLATMGIDDRVLVLTNRIDTDPVTIRDQTYFDEIAVTRTRIVTAGRDGLFVWDAATGSAHAVIAAGSERPLAWTAGEDHVAAILDGGVIRLWNLGSGAQVAEASVPAAIALTMAKDDSEMAVLDETGAVHNLEVPTLRRLSRWDAGCETSTGSVVRDARWLACLTADAVVEVDLQSGARRPIDASLFRDDPASDVSLASGGILVVRTQHRLLLFPDPARTTTATPVQLDGDGDTLVGSLVTPDGQRLLTWHASGDIECWAPDGGHLLSIRGANARTVATNATGTLVASLSDEGLIELWDGRSGWKMLTLGKAQFTPDGIAMDRSGTRVITWEAGLPGWRQDQQAGLVTTWRLPQQGPELLAAARALVGSWRPQRKEWIAGSAPRVADDVVVVEGRTPFQAPPVRSATGSDVLARLRRTTPDSDVRSLWDLYPLVFKSSITFQRVAQSTDAGIEWAAEEDLNDDGEPELLSFVEEPGVCGSMGCTYTFVIERRDPTGSTVIGMTDGCGDQLWLGLEKQDGYYDLYCRIGGWGYGRYRWRELAANRGEDANQ